MEEKEKRIRAITKLYYSNPEVQKVLIGFADSREVIPRYFEGFGKRPDVLQYPSDIQSLVNKGATSFHCSEELWHDPLQIDSDMSQAEMANLRKGWDLLIDIDSPYLDCSKIAAKLLISALEDNGIKNYGIKFSGSKGFHLIIGNKAFPTVLNGKKKTDMFPEWPRTVCRYLKEIIKKEYNHKVGEMGINFKALETRTSLKKEDVVTFVCPECEEQGKKGTLTKFVCNLCKSTIERKNIKTTKRRLRCPNEECAGTLEIVSEGEFFYCEHCGNSSWDKLGDSRHKVVSEIKSKDKKEDFAEEVSGETLGGLDLVLVSPRHLFRMPYSLHEKTALASIVITKDQIDNFSPREADPLKVQIRKFMPENQNEEAEGLLVKALAWQGDKEKEEEKITGKKVHYEDIKIEGVTEEMFPPAIKTLLKGVKDGRKRALFVLITFLRSLNFPNEYVTSRIHEWNKKNEQPLKEGYIKSQIDWHFKQKKKILPPNYDNDAFYKDLGLINKKQDTKNPLVDVIRKLRKTKEY